jgi:hypothetical protein
LEQLEPRAVLTADRGPPSPVHRIFFIGDAKFKESKKQENLNTKSLATQSFSERCNRFVCFVHFVVRHLFERFERLEQLEPRAVLTADHRPLAVVGLLSAVFYLNVLNILNDLNAAKQ